jgi:hypothetical protein
MGFFLSLTCLAQEHPSLQPVDTLPGKQVESAPALSFSTFIDTYYTYDFFRPKPGSNPHGYAGDPGNTRPFWNYNHNKVNEFNINLALIQVRYTGNTVRGGISLQVGTYPQYNYAAEQGLLKNVFEAYAGLKLVKGVWLDAGIFPSHIGLESAISKDNWTLTRSLAAENTPYYEAGAKLTIETSTKLKVVILVLNGWQNIQETADNTNKALGTQLQWQLSDNILLNSSTFFGNEKPDSTAQYRIFHNFYGTFQLSPRFSLATVFDIGSEARPAGQDGRDWWFYPGLIARYQFSDKLALNGRLEHYNDRNGVIIPVRNGSGAPSAPGFQISSASLGLDYFPTSQVMLRIEGRGFYSKSADVFNDSQGNAIHTNAILTTSLAVGF